MSDLNLERKKQSAFVLANIAELVTGVIKEIAGNDIANSINGSRITNNLIQSLVFQRLDQKLNSK